MPKLLLHCLWTLLFIRFIKLGFTTVFIGHVTFGVPYVILNVLPVFDSHKNAYEAALDLGATPLYAFSKFAGRN